MLIPSYLYLLQVNRNNLLLAYTITAKPTSSYCGLEIQQMILNTLRIPTGRWQTSLLYTSTAKELNQMFIHEFHVLELQIEMNVYDSGSFILSGALLTIKQ